MENVVDGCALSAPSCTTRGARRPRAPPEACVYRHRKLMRRVDAPTVATTASRRRRDQDDAIFSKLKFLRDAESAREQQPDRHCVGVSYDQELKFSAPTPDVMVSCVPEAKSGRRKKYATSRDRSALCDFFDSQRGLAPPGRVRGAGAAREGSGALGEAILRSF